MFFKTNIQLLRKRKKRSQEDVAAALGVKRGTINNYENGYAEPGLDMLPLFSNYYGISIDTLINIELKSLSESQLYELESGHDAYIKGSKLRVLVSTVDNKNRENIELVPVKAKAGYTEGYNDPEYIQSLPAFQLPFLSPERKYRTFQISGDSMLPIPDKAYVTSEFLQNWNEIKDGSAYIVLTMDEGIVFKVVYNQIRKKKKLLLRSLNPAYKPYEVPIGDIKEIWRFVNYISPELPEPLMPKDELSTTMLNLQQEIYKLRGEMEKVSG
jgi:transcriptional regulator with XRE-family HTH domain